MNELKYSDFLPVYPSFEQDVVDILGENYTNNLTEAEYDLYRKREFLDLKLSEIEDKPSRPGQYLKHQQMIARFLSSYTPYDGVLINWALGSGKGCGSVAAIEKIKAEGLNFRGALVLMKGINLINSYKKEITHVCTDGRYIPEGYDDLTENQKIRRINDKLSDFYEFQTFELFSKNIAKKSAEWMQKNYNNFIILIDEAHNLRSSEDVNQYSNIHRFLHTIKNSKIILMTATPARDSPDEISSLMNLILPLNKQMPEGQDFFEKFMVPKGDSYIMKNSAIQKFKSYIEGRFSFLNTMQSRVKREYIGNKVINYFKLYECQMKPFQLGIYTSAYNLDTSGGQAIKGRGVYNNSRQASLFSFPNECYGEKGFKNYVNVNVRHNKLIKNQRNTNTYTLKDNFKNEFPKSMSIEEKLEKLRKYSSKYASCVELLLKNNKENHFVFIELVEGGGAILFGLLLELFGFARSYGGNNSKAPRYAVISSKTSTPKEIREVLDTYNSPKNMYGEYIRVIIGSKVIGEGFSLKNVQSIHILTTWWNFGQTEQAIGRGLRLFSHKDLENTGVDVNVKIYLSVIKTGTNIPSIDILMYKTAEDKDISIKSMERVCKESAFDCSLNRERNILPPTLDGFRECDYTTCNYKCDNITQEEIENPEIDLSTYNLYYDDAEKIKITDQIVKLFETNKKIPLKELLYKRNPFSVLKTINNLVTTNYTVKDMFGFNMVIRFDLFPSKDGSKIEEYIYTTYELDNNGSKESNIFTNYYTDFFSLQQPTNFSKLINEAVSDNYPNIFEMMSKQGLNSDVMNELFRKFSLRAQELMLELAIESVEIGAISTCDGVKSYILNKLSDFIVKLPNDPKIISTLLYDEYNTLRCFDKKEKKWSDCEESYIDSIKDLQQEKKKDLEKNEYGYYGIYENESGIFSIRDVSKPEFISGKDARKITKGLNCEKSWKAWQLVNIADILKLPYVENKIVKNYTTKEDVIDYLIKNKSNYAAVFDLFNEEDLAEKTFDDLKRLTHWGAKMKKAVICEAIKKWFTENELLEVIVKK